jgi:SNF2 family DNA or RNA helicase
MLEREKDGAAVCRGGILGDDMGLGKTFQTIGLMKNSPLTLRTLIVCPPALMAGWTDELQACGFAVATLLQSSSWSLPVGSSPIGAGAGPTVYLTTYPKVCHYIEGLASAAQPFERVILDEGHVIRNGKATARWNACMRIAQKATCRWILSATPVQNGPADWRNLCSWLHVPSASGSTTDIGSLLMLRRTMAELRAEIEALPPLPRFVDHDLSIAEGTAEGRLFRVLCDQLENALENKSMSALIKLELWMRIQQFLVHPQIYVEAMRGKFGRGAYARPDWVSEADGCGGGGATKWTACVAELRRAIGEKIGTIVFCNFRAEMDKVAAVAEGLGAAVYSIRGGMGVDAVRLAVADAKAACSLPEAERRGVVVVVQIVSGGAGLNLQFCQRILFLSQHWNPAVVHQAVGRAVRIGQKVAVEVHFFRCVDDVLDNIDKRMMDIHVTKIAGARAICDSLYEGFAPVVIEGVEGLEAAKAAVVPPLSEEERAALVAADAIVAASAAPASAAPAAVEEVSEDPS